MSEQIQQLIKLLQEPLYIHNHIQDIKNLLIKIENEKNKINIEPHGLSWWEQRQFESDAYD